MAITTLGATGSTTNYISFLTGTTTWDPGNLTNGSSEARDVTVTGAAVGDLVVCGLTSVNASGWRLTGVVSATNTVSALLTNNTGSTSNLGSGTLTAMVFKP